MKTIVLALILLFIPFKSWAPVKIVAAKSNLVVNLERKAKNIQNQTISFQTEVIKRVYNLEVENASLKANLRDCRSQK